MDLYMDTPFYKYSFFERRQANTAEKEELLIRFRSNRNTNSPDMRIGDDGSLSVAFRPVIHCDSDDLLKIIVLHNILKPVRRPA